MAFAMKQTFQFYDRLTASGLTESQARVIIEAIEDLHEVDLKELATKSDLKALELATNSNFQALASDLKALELATNSNFQALASDLKALELATNSNFQALASDLKALELETNSDLKALESTTQSESAKLAANIKMLEIQLKIQMEKMRSSTIKWVAGILLGGIWIPLALTLFVKHLGLF